MITYTIKFWYETDCRTSCKVSANNEFMALALALHKVGMYGWCIEQGFKITIEYGG